MSALCPVCKKAFSTAQGVRDHAGMKHKKHANVEPMVFEERETFADRAIEAEQLKAAGLPVPEDIAWLLP